MKVEKNQKKNGNQVRWRKENMQPSRTHYDDQFFLNYSLEKCLSILIE